MPSFLSREVCLLNTMAHDELCPHAQWHTVAWSVLILWCPYLVTHVELSSCELDLSSAGVNNRLCFLWCLSLLNHSPELDTIYKLLSQLSWPGLITLEVKVAYSVSNNTCLWWASNWGTRLCEWVITTPTIVTATVWSIPLSRTRGTFFILICCTAQDLSEV